MTSLRTDLQQVRDDRDHQLEQVQSLVAEIANYKELTGKSAMEVEKTMIKANFLEVCLLSFFCLGTLTFTFNFPNITMFTFVDLFAGNLLFSKREDTSFASRACNFKRKIKGWQLTFCEFFFLIFNFLFVIENFV